VRIREPRPDEAEILADIHLQTWEETFTGVFPPSAWGDEARTQRIAMWTGLCTGLRPDGRLAVAEVDGELVGFALTGLSDEEDAPTERQLPFIYVLRSAQGLGVGQALLDTVLTDEAVFLWHLEHNPNPRTIRFYTRNGFAPDGAREPAGYPGAGDQIRLVRPSRRAGRIGGP
jgi:GNAT superfamily N-acetyltransferase